MANRSVVLYIRTKIGKKWAYKKVADELSQLACGEYYLSWYIKSDKHLEPVGNDPEAALNALNLKRLEMAFIAAGGEVKQPDIKKALESAYLAAAGTVKQASNVETEIAPRKLVSEEVEAYLSNCKDRGGKSGYGLAVRTYEAYEYRLGFLTEFEPGAYMDQVDGKFILGYHLKSGHTLSVQNRPTGLA